VLARQVTYDKVVRHLVRLRAEQPIIAEATLIADDKNVGQVTSAVFSPRLGPIALGIVRKPYDDIQTQLSVQTATGNNKAIVG
jgi:glycine cleavage system aminomethyltransferase T